MRPREPSARSEPHRVAHAYAQGERQSSRPRRRVRQCRIGCYRPLATSRIRSATHFNQGTISVIAASSWRVFRATALQLLSTHPRSSQRDRRDYRCASSPHSSTGRPLMRVFRDCPFTSSRRVVRVQFGPSGLRGFATRTRSLTFGKGSSPMAARFARGAAQSGGSAFRVRRSSASGRRAKSRPRRA